MLSTDALALPLPLQVIDVCKRFMGETLATAYADPRLTLVSSSVPHHMHMHAQLAFPSVAEQA